MKNQKPTIEEELIKLVRYVYGLSPHNFYRKDGNFSYKVVDAIRDTGNKFISKQHHNNEVTELVDAGTLTAKRCNKLYEKNQKLKKELEKKRLREYRDGYNKCAFEMKDLRKKFKDYKQKVLDLIDECKTNKHNIMVKEFVKELKQKIKEQK